MKISYNWLKEYLDIEQNAEDIAKLLTDIGLEVENVIEYNGPGQGLEGLIIGQVKEVKKHPDADKLQVTFVNTGNGEDLQIVCGAPNVAKDQKVVVAPVGTTLYPEKGENFQIKKAKIRGVESFGMICAEDEIGLGTDHSGIMVLPENAQVGSRVKDFFDIKSDIVFEIGLTPNRSDATSHIGVARDLKAALNVRNNTDIELRLPQFNDDLFTNKEKPIEVIIENAEACPRYSGISIRNVTVAESPNWLQERLKAVGSRPINNIVDITNFILQEYGQPLHAFDADEITGNKIVVKNLPANARFKTLDEVERNLSDADLMICDEKEGMCIAGVFGGINSGVKSATKNIFIESAYFDPVSIRKTANRHTLRTDAAIRFEKGADPNITIPALKRAVSMILEMAGGEVASEIVDVYPKPVEQFKITVNYKNIDRLIGHKIEKSTVIKILEELAIQIVEESDEQLKLSVPPFKVDVKRECDVIEEILRIYGFNNIPMPDFLRTSLSFSADTDQREKVNNAVADYLAANGFREILTNSISQSTYYQQETKGTLVELLKSSNAELNTLRANMLYSGLEAVAYNLNRRNLDLKFFDLGKIYKSAEDKYEEGEHLALFLSGSKHQDSWVAKKQKIDFFYLKSFVDNVLNRLGVENITDANYNDDTFDYGLRYEFNQKELVHFGLINKNITAQFDIKQEVYFADFNWNNVLSVNKLQSISFVEIPKFPGIRRDLALLINKSIAFAEIQKIAVEEGKRILKSVNLFDVYEDKKLGADLKSYAVSYFFEDEHKTLTDQDIDKLMNKLINRYQKELTAEIR